MIKPLTLSVSNSNGRKQIQKSCAYGWNIGLTNYIFLEKHTSANIWNIIAAWYCIINAIVKNNLYKNTRLSYLRYNHVRRDNNSYISPNRKYDSAQNGIWSECTSAWMQHPRCTYCLVAMVQSHGFNNLQAIKSTLQFVTSLCANVIQLLK